MISIEDLLKERKPVKKSRSEREDILKQMYAIYTSPGERIHRKKENWRRYIVWLKEGKLEHSDETVQKFKKTKHHIKELKEDRFWYFVCHIKKTKDLYAPLSVMRDKRNRDESASAYVISLSKNPSLF